MWRCRSGKLLGGQVVQRLGESRSDLQRAASELRAASKAVAGEGRARAANTAEQLAAEALDVKARVETLKTELMEGDHDGE